MTPEEFAQTTATITKIIQAHDWSIRNSACKCGVVPEKYPNYGGFKHAEHVAAVIASAITVTG